jgi:hypothetical protein
MFLQNYLSNYFAKDSSKTAHEYKVNKLTTVSRSVSRQKKGGIHYSLSFGLQDFFKFAELELNYDILRRFFGSNQIGAHIIIITTAKTPEEAVALLRGFGFHAAIN